MAKKSKGADGKPAKAATPPKRQSPRLAAVAASNLAAMPDLDLSAPKPAASGPLAPDAYRAQHGIDSTKSKLPDPIQSFAEAPFDKKLLGTLTTAGYAAPSPIQAQAWPVAISGVDLIAVAKTGSGKTVGFLLPAFNKILQHGPIGMGQGPLALVMAPTRELAQQIHVEVRRGLAPPPILPHTHIARRGTA